MEHVIIALWRAPDADPVTLLDEWTSIALGDERVEACTVSLADPDQPYTGEPVDAVVALGLMRAHDLDDVPARDALHHVARRVEVWRVDPRRPLSWDRTWPDGETAPGVKMVSFMRRVEGTTHEQFVRHWTERHAPLALRHHIGLWNYTQNVVRRAFTPGGGPIDGIAELHFRSRDDYENKFFDDEAGRAAIMADVKRFMAKPGPETALMREKTLR